MNVFHAAYALVSALFLSFLCVDSANAQVNLISRSSFVSSSDLFFDGSGPSETDFTTGNGIYNESRSVGDIQASQISSIINGVFDVQTFGQGANSSIEDAFTEGISGFDSEFSVPVLSEFTLAGVIDLSLIHI